MRCQLTNPIMLSFTTIAMFALLAGGNAQETKRAITPVPQAQTLAVPTQQIVAARNWGVPESDSQHAPKHGVIGWVSRHPWVAALAVGVAVGTTITVLERKRHCPGPYKSGDPPCFPDPDGK